MRSRLEMKGEELTEDEARTIHSLFAKEIAKEKIDTLMKAMEERALEQGAEQMVIDSMPRPGKKGRELSYTQRLLCRVKRI